MNARLALILCPARNHMSTRPARVSLAVLLVLLIAVSVSSEQRDGRTVPSRRTSPKTAGAIAVPLQIGGQVFRIGMSRQEALASVAECCGTSLVSNDSMVLHDRSSNTIIGSIFFKEGRVSSLVRNERQSQTKDVSDFIVSLYRGLLDGKTLLRSTPVTVTAFPDEASNATTRHIVLTFPDGRR